MSSQGAAGKSWTPKLTLESYLNLNNLDVISSSLLRKIIMMHGFKSAKIPKNDLLDAASSIELMDAHHSTLQDEFVCSDAFLGLNDVIEDLSDLHWPVCCITSIQTINSTTHFSSKGIKDDDVAECSSTVIDNGAVGGHKKKKTKFTDTVEFEDTLQTNEHKSYTSSSGTGRPTRNIRLLARYFD